MKKLMLQMLAIATIAIVFVSCGNSTSSNNAGTPQEKLDGEWKIIKATGDYASTNEGTMYIFEGVSKLTTKLGIIKTEGNITQISDSTIAVKFQGLQNDFNYNYHFEGQSLIIEPLNSGQVFTLEKQ